MTSSLRNSIHRRNHKERSQLAHRSKLGILEKHADYVKRARDYHSKQDRLNRLKQKAAERNKDEFYFSMRNTKTKEGVHIKDRGNIALPTDIVKVLKTQDENYIRTVRVAGLKKIDKLKAQLTALADLVKPSLRDGPHEEAEDELDDEELQILKDAGIISQSSKKKGKKPKHIIFVDTEEEVKNFREKRNPDLKETKSDLDAQLEAVDLGWVGKMKSEKLPVTQNTAGIESSNSAEFAVHNRRRLLKELSARLTRDKQLRYAERELEMQRLLMGKGARKKLRDVEGQDDDVRKDEDEIDARRGKRRQRMSKTDEKAYKPRVYKWRLERK